MKRILNKIIISQEELNNKIENARIQGRREARQGLSRETRGIMLSLGFFPVTDDFWNGIGRTDYAGCGLDWAYYVPDGKYQKIMPFHGWQFIEKTGLEIRYEAHKAGEILRNER